MARPHAVTEEWRELALWHSPARYWTRQLGGARDRRFQQCCFQWVERGYLYPQLAKRQFHPGGMRHLPL
jgi:hypothetical protein